MTIVRIFLNDQLLDLTQPEETRTMANEPEIQITRLRLNHFRGWDQVDVEVGPGGTIFKGKEATGKSSFLFGIRAAVEADGIGPEALRFDAPNGGVVLDMVKVEQARRTAMQLKRTIKRKGKGELELLGSDGVPIPRPKEQIDAMFSGRRLDPLEVYKVINDAKKLRQLIMEANPVTVTGEDLNRWCETAQEWNTEGHGQEVLTRVREMYEAKRKTSGQASDQAKAAVVMKTAAANGLRVDNPEPMTPEAARTHVAAAERDLAVLLDRRRQADRRAAESEGTRAKVAELRAHAEEMMGRPESVRPTEGEFAALNSEHLAALRAFDEAKLRLAKAVTDLDGYRDRQKVACDLLDQADAAINQANTLEAAIAGDEDMPALAEQTIAAEAAKVDAEAVVVRAEAAAKWRAAKQELLAAEATQKTVDEEWEKLDRIVKRLSKEAPSELAAHSDMIPGLEVTPDAVYLDKKNLTVLSGSERLKFAVALVKRMAGKAKILTVDGMEAISPAEQPAFVRMCLEGGWVLFATVVSDGPLQIVDAYSFANNGGKAA